uniref:Uncharacterized protein n=2 Tax=Oryza sativa subsp. japonica TaxID=39947 RepID=Q53N53_ORYSJ|nr:hypothetical protein LOC_Os11g17140 [Oryza sativa Japonica Group]ABA92673.1 hypothetical protein LOC_Os11g17139 [Oryza sativa Japonica Group]
MAASGSVSSRLEVEDATVATGRKEIELRKIRENSKKYN